MDIRKNIFNDLNKNVNYAVIKSRSDYINGFPEGDIDIILDKKGLIKTKTILTSHEFYLRKWGDNAKGTSIYLHNKLHYKIHIHEDLNFKFFNNEIYIRGKECFLSRKVFDKSRNLFFLSIEDEVFIQYCLMLYRNNIFIFVIKLICGRNYVQNKIKNKISYCLNIDRKNNAHYIQNIKNSNA